MIGEILRLYMETTTFNYFFDKDRKGHHDVVRLFRALGDGLHEGYVSDYVVNELKRAPEPKRSNMLGLIEQYRLTTLKITDEVTHLSNLYIKSLLAPGAFQFSSGFSSGDLRVSMLYITCMTNIGTRCK